LSAQPETGGADREYRVAIVEDPRGWRVEIASASGAVLSSRACRDGAEARTYASTVRQHLYWLSPKRFAEFYSLEV
jgi:hypothetical protein